MLQLRHNGQNYTHFTSARVVANIGMAVRSFTFTSTATANDLYPIRVNDYIEVVADDTAVILKGYIDKLDMVYSADEHTITLSGRSLLADLVDSTVKNEKLEFKESTLETICRTVIKQLGLDIVVENQAGTIAPFKDIASAEIGENAFEFLEKYSRKRQVLLTTDGTNKLLLMRAGGRRAPVTLSNSTKNAVTNNVLTSNLSLDLSQRYYRYKSYAQLNPSLLDIKATPEKISDQNGEFIDKTIRSTRNFEFNAEDSAESSVVKNRAKWECDIRTANSLKYQATVQGHTVNGVPWDINTVATVVDDYADLKRELLIRRVEFIYSLTEGSVTNLSLTHKDAFKMSPIKTIKESSSDGMPKWIAELLGQNR